MENTSKNGEHFQSLSSITSIEQLDVANMMYSALYDESESKPFSNSLDNPALYSCQQLGSVNDASLCSPDLKNSTLKCNQTLWQFLLDLLLSDKYSHLIQWTNCDGEFALLQAEEVARLWGTRKNNNNRMNYDKLSRALRYYYKKNIIQKVHGNKFVYRFMCLPDSALKACRQMIENRYQTSKSKETSDIASELSSLPNQTINDSVTTVQVKDNGKRKYQQLSRENEVTEPPFKQLSCCSCNCHNDVINKKSFKADSHIDRQYSTNSVTKATFNQSAFCSFSTYNVKPSVISPVVDDNLVNQRPNECLYHSLENVSSLKCDQDVPLNCTTKGSINSPLLVDSTSSNPSTSSNEDDSASCVPPTVSSDYKEMWNRFPFQLINSTFNQSLSSNSAYVWMPIPVAMMNNLWESINEFTQKLSDKSKGVQKLYSEKHIF